MASGVAVATIGTAPIIAGFGTVGIAAGSKAAGIQSLIGNVTAGSLLAICTSFGMRRVFVRTTAVGSFLGTGGLIAYLRNRFSTEKEANLINTIIVNQDNPELIIRLLESRLPQKREQTILFFNNNLPGNRNFDVEILLFIPDNLMGHVLNLLRNTNAILYHTP